MHPPGSASDTLRPATSPAVGGAGGAGWLLGEAVGAAAWTTGGCVAATPAGVGGAVVETAGAGRSGCRPLSASPTPAVTMAAATGRLQRSIRRRAGRPRRGVFRALTPVNRSALVSTALARSRTPQPAAPIPRREVLTPLASAPRALPTMALGALGEDRPPREVGTAGGEAGLPASSLRGFAGGGEARAAVRVGSG